MKVKTTKDYRRRRHLRVRHKVHGTAQRPRMAIMISNRHMYVQFIDDDRGVTLASASTIGGNGAHNVAAAAALGRRAAEAALGKGIRTVVVDRGGFRFHGRVKAIVNAAVATGLAISARKDSQVSPVENTQEGERSATQSAGARKTKETEST